MLDRHEAIERCKEEILADIEAGTVPASVGSFAELHNYVDANMYGGGDEEPEQEWSTDRFCEFWNFVQGEVDAWLKAGRPNA